MKEDFSSLREKVNETGRGIFNFIWDGVGDALADTEVSKKGLGISLALLAAPSCAYSTPGHITGSETGEVTHNNTPYNLERVVIHDQGYFVMDNVSPNEEELGWYLLEETAVSRTIDLEQRTVKLSSNDLYIPVRRTNKKGLKAYQVDLRTDGKYGIKSDIDFTSGGRLKIEELDEESAPYGITKVIIDDKEYFIPIVEKERLNREGHLNFDIIPVKNVKIKISPNGQLSIKNPVYEMGKVTYQEYIRRPTKQDQEKESESTTGQID